MKKVLDFTGHSKVFFGISIGIMLVGIICNIVFGAKLDIQFTGGSLVKYSYSGAVDEQQLKDLLQAGTVEECTFSISKSMLTGSSDDSYTVTVQYPNGKTMSNDEQSSLTANLQKTFPDNNFEYLEYSNIESTMGLKFFLKCLTAVAIASVLMVLYVTWRFKKIGGLSAGVMALVALFHDVAMIYFCFIIFRMPIDSNFIAVVLMILGYSLNDTIVIYDRVRENKNLLGSKTDISYMFNLSSSQVLKRTICTSVTTLTAILSVLVAALIFNLSSVVTFALPMCIGVISGCYSSICIAGPLWVIWQNHKKKVADAAKPQKSKK